MSLLCGNTIDTGTVLSVSNTMLFSKVWHLSRSKNIRLLRAVKPSEINQPKDVFLSLLVTIEDAWAISLYSVPITYIPKVRDESSPTHYVPLENFYSFLVTFQGKKICESTHVNHYLQGKFQIHIIGALFSIITFLMLIF